MSCGECVHRHYDAENDQHDVCIATPWHMWVDATDCPDCQHFSTPSQARLEKAAPAMLAALKAMCRECAESGVACSRTCLAKAAIRAAEEG